MNIIWWCVERIIRIFLLLFNYLKGCMEIGLFVLIFTKSVVKEKAGLVMPITRYVRRISLGLLAITVIVMVWIIQTDFVLSHNILYDILFLIYFALCGVFEIGWWFKIPKR